MQIKNMGHAVWAALLATGLASIAHGQTLFGKLVAFGDSLSDGGAYTNFFKSLNLPGGNQVTRFKFTTNPGNVWVENIASRFGMTLTPNALDGGLNYAEGGARVTLSNPSAVGLSQTPVSAQIDRYLASGGTFGANDIATILVGPNDIFQGGPDAIVPAVTALMTQVGRLQAAGARNIVVVSLPDIGLTPAFGAGSGAASAQASQLAASFNASLKLGLQGLTSNVLNIDAFALYREVVADPTRYGLTNVIAPACITMSAGQCTPATTAANGAEGYLFADGVHPSTAGHRLLSDIVIATLLAPSQISLLPLSVQALARGQQLAYDDRLFPQGNRTARTWELFGGAGYTSYKVDSSGQLNGVDTNGKDVTFGADYQLSPTGGMGVALSHTRANSDFGNDTGSFETKLTSLNVYGRATVGRMYAFANAGYGRASLDDIRRDAHINTFTRTESGATSGRTGTFKAGAGYDLLNGRFAAGPLVSLNYEHIKLDGYTEDGASSTQLTFGAQTLSDLTGSIGLQARLADNSAPVLPYVRASYDYDLNHDGRAVSIQNQTGATYQGAAYLPARSVFSLAGGARINLMTRLYAAINASGMFGQSDVSNYRVTGTLNVRF